MNYSAKTTIHVADYKHTVIRNLQAAITDKDNGYGSSIVTPASAQLQLKSFSHPHRSFTGKRYMNRPAFQVFDHVDLPTRHTCELHFIHKWFMVK